MIAKIHKTIKKYGLLEKGDSVVVGVSGGPDSIALLTGLVHLMKQYDLKLTVAHFNHGLRGRESDADEKYSRDLAEKLGLNFCAGNMDRKKNKKGLSPEDFYRRQRYDFLYKTAADYKARKIALGHHLNDQAETVLLNMLRGSGREGLKGILPMREGKIIRPLLETSRQEIISFLRKSHIPYREDSSNPNRVYLRNKIRAGLIPYLKKNYNPVIEETLAQTAEILRVENEFIEQCVDRALRSPDFQYASGRVSAQIDFLNRLPAAICRRVFKNILEDLAPSGNGIFFIHIRSVEDLLRQSASGKKLILPQGIQVRKEYDRLIFAKKNAFQKMARFDYVMDIPGAVIIKERGLKVSASMVRKSGIDLSARDKIYLDFERIKQPLRIRNRRNGDWFQPLGMNGRQKLKDFFIDHKIPAGRRDEIILLVDGISVIYIENMHLNDRVKITPQTKKVLEIDIRHPS